ncbi:2-oxo-4-hydroxy-4-carboxy-5-ureidoimidazoline decarboxylase [Spirilliplanes yamanashiensis]|uniref:2-oxo-4-hydroxy-4-carboxy-5-ureidoimidazoline decarboxylase n=1 Tax=Spirilliplanes yamanashiensis TaxID=42233 RepID=A0A8J3YB07_9ACTN|nr:2-oxo-4-hydroxy-4-carboxy-5-ureidoimidazoline decarboxylase [Spirilliplanes yamanashiensis]MDP9818769.1 2-oxo-4-hydroxy-4-carboxy-5-ureidoimidazoline decarboxylase [Spirilliplanes yamanashiensis]GIJ05223.1 OHCU decarboxylase [Spirilliplanes yamanashiensis]
MLEAFNGLPAEHAERELLACCAAPAWAAAVAAGRPYPSTAALLAAADAAARDLSWADVEQALAAHPRIGERPAGDSREAAWSRREQGAADAGAAMAAALAEANRAYEEKFGRVFLIFASGRTADELLAAARERLGNDERTERAVVAGELRKIALLRLERLIDER